MLDKPEMNLLFPRQRVNFSSLCPGTSHFQNADITTSSYFMDMDIVEDLSKKKKIMSQKSKDGSGLSPVSSGNNQYCDKDKFSMGQQVEFDNINKVLLSNLRPCYFQQKEPSLFHQTFKEENVNLRDIENIGRVRQLEQGGYLSEYGCDLVNTSFYGQDKQQCDIPFPVSHVALESSNSEQACLESEKLKNKAFVSKVLESIYLEKKDALKNGHKDQSLLEKILNVNVSLNSDRFTATGDVFSANMDERNKPIKWRLSPVISEKIWDGSLKLNTSITVSSVAIFKSGEKVQDLNWPDNIEIKGKVRLHAFEKFIQELPRSRNRALMVISLCWKLGSCQSGLAGMMEVAKGYRETERVGFAQIPPGIDLYVCPRSDTIITILAKYGFYKGVAAVEEDQDSLIGCVVWRRCQSSTNLVSQIAVEGKKVLMQEKPLKSTGLSVEGLNSPPMETGASEKKVMPCETELKAGLELPDSEAAKAIAMPETKCIITESNAATSSSSSHHASIFHSSDTVQTIMSIPYSCTLVPTQQNTLLRENMKKAGTFSLSENSGTDRADLVSDSWTGFVSPPQMAPVFVLQNTLSSSNSQSLGMVCSVPVPGPRPLIPINSSNFQFQPQLTQKTHSSLSGDGNAGSEKNPKPSFQTVLPALPKPPPLPSELLQSFIQSMKNVPEGIINGRILQDKTQIMHHKVTIRPADVLDARAPATQIKKNCGGSNDDNDDDDDLPEFDFNYACEEQPDASTSRLSGLTRPTHYPVAASSLNEISFEAENLKSFEAFQHGHKHSSLPGKSNPNEGSFLVQNFGEDISKKPSTEAHPLPRHQLNGLKEGKDLGNGRPRPGSCSEHKSLWDDDDDMPEWCPPDLDLPELPLPSANENARLLLGRTLPPPPSFHPQTRSSNPGLLGPCPPPSSAPLAGFIRSSKPPLGSRRSDSIKPIKPNAGNKFKRSPRYDVGHRRH